MWGQIRGRGLAYDFGLNLSTDVGLLYFSLSNATHLVDAFKKAATIVKEHIEGKWKLPSWSNDSICVIVASLDVWSSVCCALFSTTSLVSLRFAPTCVTDV